MLKFVHKDKSLSLQKISLLSYNNLLDILSLHFETSIENLYYDYHDIRYIVQDNDSFRLMRKQLYEDTLIYIKEKEKNDTFKLLIFIGYSNRYDLNLNVNFTLLELQERILRDLRLKSNDYELFFKTGNIRIDTESDLNRSRLDILKQKQLFLIETNINNFKLSNYISNEIKDEMNEYLWSTKDGKRQIIKKKGIIIYTINITCYITEKNIFTTDEYLKDIKELFTCYMTTRNYNIYKVTSHEQLELIDSEYLSDLDYPVIVIQ